MTQTKGFLSIKLLHQWDSQLSHGLSIPPKPSTSQSIWHMKMQPLAFSLVQVIDSLITPGEHHALRVPTRARQASARPRPRIRIKNIAGRGKTALFQVNTSRRETFNASRSSRSSTSNVSKVSWALSSWHLMASHNTPDLCIKALITILPSARTKAATLSWVFASSRLRTPACKNKNSNRQSLRIFQHTPGTYPRPQTNTLWFGIPFIWGFGETWGMLHGYVGVLLDFKVKVSNHFLAIVFSFTSLTSTISRFPSFHPIQCTFSSPFEAPTTVSRCWGIAKSLGTTKSTWST